MERDREREREKNTYCQRKKRDWFANRPLTAFCHLQVVTQPRPLQRRLTPDAFQSLYTLLSTKEKITKTLVSLHGKKTGFSHEQISPRTFLRRKRVNSLHENTNFLIWTTNEICNVPECLYLHLLEA